MKIYRLESDHGYDNNTWTVGYYSTLKKAISKAKQQIEGEIQEILEEDEYIPETEEVILDDFTGPMAYGINAKENGRWSFGVYVYQIEVDDNE